jgi:hypothetical protein
VTASVIAFARQRGARQRVVALGDDLVEPWMETAAAGDAGADFADVVLALSRQIQRALAAGHLTAAATFANELEQIAPRVGLRARIASSVARERLAELNGIADSADAIGAPGHGAAA